MPCKRMLSLVLPFAHQAQLQARTLVALHHLIHMPIDIPHHEVVVGAGGGI